MLGDVRQCLSEIQIGERSFDAWYLDGFAPAKNPQMWSPEVFELIAGLSRPGSTLSSFTVAGDVRRGLEKVGFQVTKTPGFGRKREMLQATLLKKSPSGPAGTRGHANIEGAYTVARSGKNLERPWFLIPTRSRNQVKSITIIGAGLAGSALAEAFSRRGFRIRVYESADAPARGASGNPIGVIRPTLTAAPTAFSGFSLAAFAYLLRHLSALRDEGHEFGYKNCGVLQLFSEKNERKRLEKSLEQLSLDPDLARLLSLEEARQICGREVQTGGLYFPRGAEVSPPRLCEANLKRNPGVELITEQNVSYVVAAETSGGQNIWRLHGKDDELLEETEILIIAGGDRSLEHAQVRNLPLIRIRGQVFSLPASKPLENPGEEQKTTISYDGYITTAHQGRHVVGASFEVGDREQIDPSENLELYKKLIEYIPDITRNISILSEGMAADEYIQNLPARVSFRMAGRDRMPLIGPAPEKAGFTRNFRELAARSIINRNKLGITPRSSFYPGLYLSLGHGSRGLLYSHLGAELLAAMVCDEPLPVEKYILDALNPARFWIRDLKKT